MKSIALAISAATISFSVFAASVAGRTDNYLDALFNTLTQIGM